MEQKNLKEFLVKDQEPFDLNTFIDERKRQLLKRASPSPSPSFPSPEISNVNPHEVRKPPAMTVDFKAAARRPTAHLLVEAALRVAVTSPVRRKKNSGRSIKGLGYLLFGSLLKRLAFKKRVHELERKEIKEGSLPLGFLKVAFDGEEFVEGRSGRVIESVGSRNDGQDEERDRYGRSSRVVSDTTGALIGSSGDGTPSPTSSPARSPRRRREIQRVDGGGGKAEKEEKEQLSPASVLDPSFDDEEEEDDEKRGPPHAHVAPSGRAFPGVQGTEAELLPRRFDLLVRLGPVQLDQHFAVPEMAIVDLPDLAGKRTGTHDVDILAVDLAGDGEGNFISRGEARAERSVDDVVEADLRSSALEWMTWRVDMGEVSGGIELAVLELLVDEFSDEMISSCATSQRQPS